MNNIELVNEEIRHRNEELTVKENVEKQLAKVIKRKLVHHRPSFLKPAMENLTQIYVNHTDLFTEERTRDVPDEKLLERQR